MVDLPQAAADLVDSFTDDVLTTDGFHSPGTFKQRYPQFNTLQDSTIDVFLQEALMHVDTTWANPFRLKAHGLVAGHLLVCEGYGTAATVGGVVNVQALKDLGVKQFSIDDMSVTLADASSQSGSGDDHFMTTNYGKQFVELRKKLFGGGIVV